MLVNGTEPPACGVPAIPWKVHCWHCLNCGEPTHGSHSLTVSRTVCTPLHHAYVARPCTHCVPELGHCTSRTVLHTPAAFPWAATAGQRPSAWLPTQAGPRAGPIATERVGAAGSSTPRGASACGRLLLRVFTSPRPALGHRILRRQKPHQKGLSRCSPSWWTPPAPRFYVPQAGPGTPPLTGP